MPRDLEIMFTIVSVFMCVPVCVPALVCVSEDQIDNILTDNTEEGDKDVQKEGGTDGHIVKGDLANAGNKTLN